MKIETTNIEAGGYKPISVQWTSQTLPVISSVNDSLCLVVSNLIWKTFNFGNFQNGFNFNLQNANFCLYFKKLNKFHFPHFIGEKLSKNIHFEQIKTGITPILTLKASLKTTISHGRTIKTHNFVNCAK